MYDISKGVLHDITSSQGFMMAIKGVLRLKPGALLWLGVPCNTILNRMVLFILGWKGKHTYRKICNMYANDLVTSNMLIHDVGLNPTKDYKKKALMFKLSWIWISRSTTKRSSLSFGVMGDEQNPSVLNGNIIAARVALLIMIAIMRGVYWCDFWL